MTDSKFSQVNVLDHGFVKLLDVMGSDKDIVDAARISTYQNGVEKTELQDRRLINYLMKNEHTSPFEMAEFKFHVKLPIFVMRQWVRHRTANINEMSGRYVELKNEYYVPDNKRLLKQSESDVQGSSDEQLGYPKCSEIINNMQLVDNIAFHNYDKFIEAGLARETSRIILPLNTYTEMVWKIDLHNLFRFLKLRLDAHAQYEIRVYAKAIADMIKNVVPMSFSAFEEHILYAKKFSYKEYETLKKTILEKYPDADLKGII